MKLDDTKLYMYFAIAMLVVGILFGLPGIYSRIATEPAILSHLHPESSSEQLKQAYILLRDPHIFSGYDRFDAGSAGIEYILKEFDARIVEKKDFSTNDAIYLEVLLERRMQGSGLSIATMVFFLLLSLLGAIALGIEIKRLKTAR